MINNMDLTQKQYDTLKEIINIGVGKSAATLNEMLQSHIDLSVPKIAVQSIDECTDLLLNTNSIDKSQLSAVKMNFHGSLNGCAELIFPQDSASHLVSSLIGEIPTNDEVVDLKAGTVSEVGNIILNGVMGSITNLINGHVEYTPLEYFEGDHKNILRIEITDKNIVIIFADTKFIVKDLNITGNIILMYSVDTFKKLEIIIDRMNL